MKAISLIALCLFAFVGCSHKQDVATPAHSGSLYPRDAATVTTNADYVAAYTGEKSGITYYLRRVTREESGQFPDDKVILGDKYSVVFVPIKDGKIVSFAAEDHMNFSQKAAALMAQ